MTSPIPDIDRVRHQIDALTPHFEGLTRTHLVTLAFLMQAQGMALALDFALKHDPADIEASRQACDAVAADLAAGLQR